MSALDEVLATMEASPRDLAAVGALARDAGNLLRPSDEEALAGLIRALAVRRRRLTWLDRSDRDFEAGAFLALQEVLGAAAAAQRADRGREREAASERPFAARVYEALRERPLRPSELARDLGVEGPRVSRALRTLERDGAITRLELEPGQDRRTRRYTVSHPGKAGGTTTERVAAPPRPPEADLQGAFATARSDLAATRTRSNKVTAVLDQQHEDLDQQHEDNVLAGKGAELVSA